MGQILSHTVDRHVDPFEVDPNEVALQSTDMGIVYELHHQHTPQQELNRKAEQTHKQMEESIETNQQMIHQDDRRK